MEKVYFDLVLGVASDLVVPGLVAGAFHPQCAASMSPDHLSAAGLCANSPHELIEPSMLTFDKLYKSSRWHSVYCGGISCRNVTTSSISCEATSHCRFRGDSPCFAQASAKRGAPSANLSSVLEPQPSDLNHYKRHVPAAAWALQIQESLRRHIKTA